MTPDEAEREITDLEDSTAARVRRIVADALAGGVDASRLRSLARRLADILRGVVVGAAQLGARIAQALAGLRPRRVVIPPAVLPPVTPPIERVVARAVADLEHRPRRQVAERAADQLADVGQGLVTRAVAAGTEVVARRRPDAEVMWIAERDACLTCQRLSGHIMPPGRRFPASVTYGDKPLKWDKFDGHPPRHPHCRCRIRVVIGDMSAASAALQREARRSVVRGFSMPGESGAARVRAADRLLRRGAGLPRSVEEYGRAAVAAGRFLRGRQVPAGAGRRPR
ncbi:hypothetical protein Aph01nite_43670 [Acrocarpospora phusangensis]|uniref:Uncharacterized protein n=1 Tax=Acrocarpospora phusangensis TaxID=1070424 RepID=A0A919UPT2_9ACTN|nr:hypothetical protein [Acrocarpospora phusangensis]GIH26057.1 hypothetical protein Aph01nite_43670 [Acrocarpospora phusangensis]